MIKKRAFTMVELVLAMAISLGVGLVLINILSSRNFDMKNLFEVETNTQNNARIIAELMTNLSFEARDISIVKPSEQIIAGLEPSWEYIVAEGEGNKGRLVHYVYNSNIGKHDKIYLSEQDSTQDFYLNFKKDKFNGNMSVNDMENGFVSYKLHAVPKDSKLSPKVLIASEVNFRNLLTATILTNNEDGPAGIIFKRREIEVEEVFDESRKNNYFISVVYEQSYGTSKYFGYTGGEYGPNVGVIEKQKRYHILSAINEFVATISNGNRNNVWMQVYPFNAKTGSDNKYYWIANKMNVGNLLNYTDPTRLLHMRDYYGVDHEPLTNVLADVVHNDRTTEDPHAILGDGVDLSGALTSAYVPFVYYRNYTESQRPAYAVNRIHPDDKVTDDFGYPYPVSRENMGVPPEYRKDPERNKHFLIVIYDTKPNMALYAGKPVSQIPVALPPPDLVDISWFGSGDFMKNHLMYEDFSYFRRSVRRGNIGYHQKFEQKFPSYLIYYIDRAYGRIQGFKTPDFDQNNYNAGSPTAINKSLDVARLLSNFSDSYVINTNEGDSIGLADALKTDKNYHVKDEIDLKNSMSLIAADVIKKISDYDLEVSLLPKPSPTPKPTPAPPTPTPIDGIDWQPEKIYNKGDRVRHNGKYYIAKWWTKGDRPDITIAWEREDKYSAVPYDPQVVYTQGDRVLFNNRVYVAKWWVQGQSPDTSDAFELEGPPVYKLGNYRAGDEVIYFYGGINRHYRAKLTTNANPTKTSDWEYLGEWVN